MPLPTNAKPVAYVLARDRSVTLPFYRDILGLPVRSENPHVLMLDARGVTLGLTTITDHVPSPHPVISWEVADIQAASRALAAQGVRFNDYPGMTEGPYAIWTAPDGSAKLNWFSDPEGNVLGLTERG